MTSGLSNFVPSSSPYLILLTMTNLNLHKTLPLFDSSLLLTSNMSTDHQRSSDTKIAVNDLISWFKTYDRNAGIKWVAEKLGISETEANEKISLTEEKLILIQNQEGKDRIKTSELAKTSDLNNLGPKYRRQIGSTCCGVASLATAKDLLEQNVEFTSEPEMFKITQTLDEKVVRKRGMTLEELWEASKKLFPSDNYEVIKQVPDSIENLRELLIHHFQRKMPAVLLSNYCMKLAGEGDWWAGHISPIAAYDEVSDSALILDVWKFTDPFWINLRQLLSSTVLSIDQDSQKSRGFVQIIKKC